MKMRFAHLAVALAASLSAAFGNTLDGVTREVRSKTASAISAEDIQKAFAGIWELEPQGWLVQAPNGTVTYPLTVDAQGRLMVTESGFFSIYINNPHRHCAPPVCSASEVPSNWNGFQSLAGRMEQIHPSADDLNSGDFVFHEDFDKFPNFIGGSFPRGYLLEEDGERLTISISRNGSVTKSIWRRRDSQRKPR